VVYGGGGVVPDIKIEPTKYNPLEINLERKMLFFDFAVSYSSKHKDIPADFEVDIKMVDEFRQFLKDKKFSYKTALEFEVEKLDKSIKEDKKEDIYKESLENLKKQIEKEKESDFQNSLDYVKRSLKRDMLLNLYGEKAFYEQIILKTDPSILRALKILNSKEEYKKSLKG
jgi:carboxyl-terminal processing protease